MNESERANEDLKEERVKGLGQTRLNANGLLQQGDNNGVFSDAQLLFPSGNVHPQSLVFFHNQHHKQNYSSWPYPLQKTRIFIIITIFIFVFITIIIIVIVSSITMSVVNSSGASAAE